MRFNDFKGKTHLHEAVPAVIPQSNNPVAQNKQASAPPKADKPLGIGGPAAEKPQADHSTPGQSPAGKLTKDWIQFLKNNQIVAAKSDPNSGKLTYKRKANTNDLIHFLESKTDFDEETIYSAIQSALSGSQPEPEQQEPQQQLQQEPQQDQSQDKDDVTDVDYRDVPPDTKALPGPQAAHGGKKAGEVSQTPDAIRKRNARSAGGQAFGQMQKQLKRKGTLKEEFTDQPVDLSEKNVEDVFSTLASQSQGAGDEPQQGQEKPQQAKPQANKQANIEKLKKLIKTGMSRSQRKALWKALNDDVLAEEYIDKNYVKKAFKYAAKLSKESISIEDLRQAWKEAGYPSDTQEIGDILENFGFEENDVNRVFNEILGGYDVEGDDKPRDEPPSPAIIKIAEYAKKNGLKDELIAFLQQNYGDELEDEPEDEPEEIADEPKKGMFGRMKDLGKSIFGRKATTEEVRQIFTAMLQEERSMRHILIKEQDKRDLGRQRK